MIERIGDFIVRAAAVLAGVVLVAMTLYTLAEILMRGLLGFSTNVLVEFVGYGLAAMTLLGAAHTMRSGGMIRVNILLQFAPPRLRQILDLFCVAVGISVVGFTAVFVWFDMQRSFERGYETDSVVPLPLWLPPLGLLLGLVTFLIAMLMELVRVARGTTRLADKASDP